MARLRIECEGRTQDLGIGTTVLTLGRGEESTIVLDDKQASRVHCQIEKFDGGYKVVDLESRNGTKVNGNFVNQHVLKNGDRIEVGAVVVTFLSTATEDTDPAMQPPPAAMRKAAAAKLPLPVKGPATEPTSPAMNRQSGPVPRVPRRAAAGGMGATAVILLSILLIGFLAYKAATAQEDPDVKRARLAWDEANRFEKRGQFGEALNALKSIDVRQADYFDKAQKRIPEVERELQEAKIEKQKEEENERIREFQQYAKANAGKPEELQKHFELFKREFPASSAIPELEKWMKGLKPPKNSGDDDDDFGSRNPPPTGNNFDTIQTVAQQLQSSKKFGEAMKILKEFIGKDPTSKDAEKANDQVKEILSEAEVYFGEKFEQGKLAVQTQKFPSAREAYEAVISSSGDEKTLYEFVLRARQELKHVEELEKMK